MGSKIEGGGTDVPPSLCLHIGSRGTTAQEEGAVTCRKPQLIKALSGAVFALVRWDALGACHESRG